MRVAIPDWQGRISPVFDVAGQILIVDIEAAKDESRHRERLEGLTLQDRVERLAEVGVNTVICGAISWRFEALLLASGIRTISLICGDVAEVLRAYRTGTLDRQKFAMPGCGRNEQGARHPYGHQDGDTSMVECTHGGDRSDGRQERRPAERNNLLSRLMTYRAGNHHMNVKYALSTVAEDRKQHPHNYGPFSQ
jgi:predicted Fe-Mo cluster-binding NifX family protein